MGACTLALLVTCFGRQVKYERDREEAKANVLMFQACILEKDNSQKNQYRISSSTLKFDILNCERNAFPIRNTLTMLSMLHMY